MATEKLIAGSVPSWTALMTTELNALASGNAILGTTSVDNATNLDLYVEFSFVGGGSITPTGTPSFPIAIYPQNGDGTTYGDGRFGAAAAGPPPSNYYKGFIGLPAAAGTQVGTSSIPGAPILQITQPRGIWRPVFTNLSGVTLTATGNILYYRTSNRQIV